jgi:hypothetical protein
VRVGLNPFRLREQNYAAQGRKGRTVERANIKEKKEGKNVNKRKVEEGGEEKRRGMKRGRIRSIKTFLVILPIPVLLRKQHFR